MKIETIKYFLDRALEINALIKREPLLSITRRSNNNISQSTFFKVIVEIEKSIFIDEYQDKISWLLLPSIVQYKLRNIHKNGNDNSKAVIEFSKMSMQFVDDLLKSDLPKSEQIWMVKNLQAQIIFADERL